jgi:hypothetical protein
MDNTKTIVISLAACILLASCGSGEPPSSGATEMPSAAPTSTNTPEPPTATPTLSPMAEALVGQWINLSPGGGYTWFTIRVEGEEAVAHFWGMCHPEPCDAGFTRMPIAELDDGQFVYISQFANGTTTVEVELQDDLSVQITQNVDFTEESGMTDASYVYYYGDSATVTGASAFVGTWVHDNPANDEYTRLSIALDSGQFVIIAQAMIDGQVHDFGQFNEIESIDDGTLGIYYDYPGGGLIVGECVPSGDGGLTVEMFVEHMVDGVYTTHEAVYTMRRLD